MTEFSSKDRATNWDNYYQKPSLFAGFTRKTTERILIEQLTRRQYRNPIQSICELGGGNSCFFSAIRRHFPKTRYTVVDNNELGALLFKNQYPDDHSIDLHIIDVLESEALPDNQDVVFSVGLIEHFSPSDTARVIEKHVQICKPGGLIIITFPTPTWLYKTIRSVSEAFKLWIFHDERPLRIADVIRDIEPHACVMHHAINWGTLLTQGVVVAVKPG